MIISLFKRKLGFASVAILASLLINSMVTAMDDQMEEDRLQGQKRTLEYSSAPQPGKKLKLDSQKSLSNQLLELVDQHMGKDKGQFCFFTNLYKREKGLIFDIFSVASDAYHNIFSVNKAFYYTARYTKTDLKDPECEEVVGAADKIVLLFPNLKKLNLMEYENISDDALSQLQKLTFLAMNNLDYISSQGISPLTNLKSLSLNLEDYRADDLNMDAGLSGLTLLENLTLNIADEDSNRYVTDQGIAPLVNLRSLHIYTANGIMGSCLANLTNLRNLTLIDNDHIKNEHISSMTYLQNLNLRDNQNITFGAIQNFTNLKKLMIVPTSSGLLVMSGEEQRILKMKNPGLEIITEYDPYFDQKMDVDNN